MMRSLAKCTLAKDSGSHSDNQNITMILWGAACHSISIQIPPSQQNECTNSVLPHQGSLITSGVIGVFFRLSVRDPVPRLDDPGAQQWQQAFWSDRHARKEEMAGIELCSVKLSRADDLDIPAHSHPLLASVLLDLFCTRGPGDASPMAEPVIRCLKKDLVCSSDFPSDLLIPGLFVGVDRKNEFSQFSLQMSKKRFGSAGIQLDQQVLQIHRAHQLFMHCLLMVVSDGRTSLADGQIQRPRVKRYRCNEHRFPSWCGFDRVGQSLTVLELLKPSAASEIWTIIQSQMAVDSNLNPFDRKNTAILHRIVSVQVYPQGLVRTV